MALMTPNTVSKNPLQAGTLSLKPPTPQNPAQQFGSFVSGVGSYLSKGLPGLGKPKGPTANVAPPPAGTTPGVLPPPAAPKPVLPPATPQINAAQVTPPTTPPVAPIPSTNPIATGAPGLFSSVASSLAGNASQVDPAYTAGLQKYNELSKTIADTGIAGARAIGGYETTPGTEPVAEGAAAIAQTQTNAALTRLAAQQEAALKEAGLGQAQQGLEQTALKGAGELAYPIALTPPQYLVSPTEAGTPGTGQAAGYKSKADYEKALANLGIGAGSTQQAAAIGSALANYRSTLKQTTDFLSANGINEGNIPAWNAPIQNWIGQVSNPAAKKALDAYINDLKNFQGALINQGVDLTPSGTQYQTFLTDPTALSVPQLQALGEAFDNLGATRLSTANAQAAGAYGAASTPGGTYSGSVPTPATPPTPIIPPNTSVGGFNPQNASPAVQFLSGLGLGFGNMIGGHAGSAAAGAAAEWLFKTLPGLL